MPVDFAPKQDHIALRQRGLVYYVPEVFHQSPTVVRICPLFISDIHNLTSILSIYGVLGLQKHTDGYFLVGNHPVRRVCIFGRIMTAELHHNQDPSKNYMVLVVEDNSGDDSCITVKVLASAYTAERLDSHSIVSCTGTVTQYYDRQPELSCSEIRRVGDRHDLAAEVTHWEERLDFHRRYLDRPWVYTPPIASPSVSAVPRLTRELFHQKQAKRATLEVPVVIPRCEDSVILRKHQLGQNRRELEESSTIAPEVIYIGSQDESSQARPQNFPPSQYLVSDAGVGTGQAFPPSQNKRKRDSATPPHLQGLSCSPSRRWPSSNSQVFSM